MKDNTCKGCVWSVNDEHSSSTFTPCLTCSRRHEDKYERPAGDET